MHLLQFLEHGKTDHDDTDDRMEFFIPFPFSQLTAVRPCPVVEHPVLEVVVIGNLKLDQEGLAVFGLGLNVHDRVFVGHKSLRIERRLRPNLPGKGHSRIGEDGVNEAQQNVLVPLAGKQKVNHRVGSRLDRSCVTHSLIIQREEDFSSGKKAVANAETVLFYPLNFGTIPRFSVSSFFKEHGHGTLDFSFCRLFFRCRHLFWTKSQPERTDLAGIPDWADLSAEHRIAFAVDPGTSDEAADDPRFRQAGKR